MLGYNFGIVLIAHQLRMYFTFGLNKDSILTAHEEKLIKLLKISTTNLQWKATCTDAIVRLQGYSQMLMEGCIERFIKVYVMGSIEKMVISDFLGPQSRHTYVPYTTVQRLCRA